MFPLTVKTPLDKAEKRLEQLKHVKVGGEQEQITKQEYAREVQEIIESISHALDRLLNYVWENVDKSKEGKKPYIYWPMSKSLSQLNDRLRQMQLESLEHNYPGIHELIVGTQSFVLGENGWCPAVKTIANLKHERDVEIHSEEKVVAIKIGKGETFIERLDIGDLGEITYLRGFQIQGGELQPLTVEHEVRAVELLEKNGSQPAVFIGVAIREARTLAYAVTKELGK